MPRKTPTKRTTKKRVTKKRVTKRTPKPACGRCGNKALARHGAAFQCLNAECDHHWS